MNDDFLRTLQAYMTGVDPALAAFFRPQDNNGQQERQTEAQQNPRVLPESGQLRLEAPGPGPSQVHGRGT